MPKQTTKQLLERWSRIFIAVLTVATIAPQILSSKPAFADDGGYPWIGATTLNASTGDFGYSTCPLNDTGCFSLTNPDYPGYGEADPWIYNLRNCTSYAAWKVNQMFDVNVNGWGNASTWDTKAHDAGYTIYPGSSHTPAQGELAQWGTEKDDGLGHVAYVGSVTNGVATLWEYNVGLDGLFYSTRTTASNSAGTPDHWIHIGSTTTIGFTRVNGSNLEWHLRNTNSAGSSDLTFNFGTSTDTPVVGDWDGNGTVTVGFARANGSNLEWHLRNSNSAGSSDLIFNYGTSTDRPLVGDWDGNGTTTVGFTNVSGSDLTWHLRNSNSAGSSNLLFSYGTSTDVGIVGDWDGNGTTTVGFTNVSGSDLTWHLRNSNSAGSSDLMFSYGTSTDIPVVGDWDGDGDTTIGFTNISGSDLYWHLRNNNSAGSSDLIFNYGASTDNGNGVTGDWDGA